jgi:hypothetical protein
VLASAAAMMVALSPMKPLRGPVAMTEEVVIGIGIYTLCLLVLDFLGLREALWQKVLARRAAASSTLTLTTQDA